MMNISEVKLHEFKEHMHSKKKVILIQICIANVTKDEKKSTKDNHNTKISCLPDELLRLAPCKTGTLGKAPPVLDPR